MPKGGTGKDNKGKQALSKDIILTQALQLADAEGIENVSTRKLAESLGKTAMSLYRYFDSIDEIHQGIVALAFTEVDTAPISGERWDDTLRRTTTSIRQMNLRHPRAHFHFVKGVAWSPALKGHTDRIQKLHREQGIPEDILVRTWRIVDAFLTGFEINELEEFDRTAPPLPSDEPEWIPTVAQAYTEGAFKDGIEIIIAGIREIAMPDPCEWYTP